MLCFHLLIVFEPLFTKRQTDKWILKRGRPRKPWGPLGTRLARPTKFKMADEVAAGFSMIFNKKTMFFKRVTNSGLHHAIR